MKKIWNYRFYILTILGLSLMSFNLYNAESNLKLVLWAIGMLISFVGMLLQIILAPNFNAKCPDCNADINFQGSKVIFKNHCK